MAAEYSVAVLGLGAMGSRMAARLLASGRSVTVWNRSPGAADALIPLGAHVAATPAEAARGAGAVLAMVRDDDASRAVWLENRTGAVHGIGPGAVAIDGSTLTPDWTRTLAGVMSRRGVDFLEAPVLGSRPQADAGQLIHLVGGDPVVLARVEPILRALGGAIHPVGAVGTAASLKLAINALFGIQVAALAELLEFLRASGLEIGAAMEIVGATPVCSPAARAAGTAMTGDVFAPMFPIDLVAKDFGYAETAAQVAGASVPMLRAASAVFAAAAGRSWGGDNLTAVVRLYRRSA